MNKTTTKRLLAAILGLILLSTPAMAQFTFTTNNGAITITEGCTDYSRSVVIIPSTINGYPVTSIGVNAFNGCPLTSVVNLDSVTSIGGLGVPSLPQPDQR